MRKPAAVSKKSQDTEQSHTRRRGGSYNNENLEYTAWKLLLTHQQNNNPEQPAANKSKFEEVRRALAQRALKPESASALSAAFCLALLDEDIETPFENLRKTSDHCPDSQYFGSVRDTISKTTVFVPFITHPKKLDTTQKNALFEYASKSCQNSACVMLTAARFETAGETSKAVYLYAHLMSNNYLVNAQLANLIRIGGRSPEALFQIGKYILEKTFNVDKFKIPLVAFLKSAHAQLRSADSPKDILDSFDELLKKDEPMWDDIALMCINLAVYNKRNSHGPAARYLSDITMKGEHTRQSPQKACTTIEYAYRRTTGEKEKAKLLKTLMQLHKSNPTDLWVNSMLASVYTDSLKSPRGSDEESILEDTRKAYDHYQVVYDLLFSANEAIEFYNRAYTLFPTLPNNCYELVDRLLKLHDKYRSNTNIGPTLLKQAVNLLEQSSRLGHSQSHWQLATLKENRLNRDSSDAAREKVNFHYCCALERALVALNVTEFLTILGRYRQFVTRYFPTQQLLVQQFQQRGNDLKLNLAALKLCSEGKYDNSEFKELSTLSPIACAVDWENSSLFESTYYNRFIGLLSSRGFFDTRDPNFIADIITLLTDYFVLASKDKQASVFFTCLQRGLSQTSAIDDTTAEKIDVLIDFFRSIIDDNLLECKRIVKSSPDFCAAAFKKLSDLMVLKPETYYTLQAILKPQKEESASLQRHSGPRFFDDSADEQLFSQWREQWRVIPAEERLSAKRNIQFAFTNASNSPRGANTNKTIAGSAPESVSPLKLMRPPAKTNADEGPPPPSTKGPKRRFSLPLPLKEKPSSAPGELASGPTLRNNDEGSSKGFQPFK